MLFKVFALNAFILLGFGLIGYWPMVVFKRRFSPLCLSERLFISVLFGFFIFESLIAIWFSKGATVQWANFLPFLLLPFLPNSKEENSESSKGLSIALVPLLVLVFGSWYFVSSYAPDLKSLNRYPFIDLVSYSSTAFGLQFSGNETAFFDSSIYFPDKSEFNLYHFTELWALVGISNLFGVTHLYGISFLIPVCLLVVAAMGFAALAQRLKIPFLISTGLVIAILFANGKLLFFNDAFLYNVLDLCGLKISLIIPVLIFLYIIRSNNSLALCFSLWLPQVNILLTISVGLFWCYQILKDKTTFWKKKPLVFWLLPIGLAFLYISLLLTHPSESQSFPLHTFNVSGWLIRSFSYFREALFNLGINYWLPLILLSSLFHSWKYSLVLIPFGLVKIISKFVFIIYAPAVEWSAIYESLIFVVGCWFLPLPFENYKTSSCWIFCGLMILCLIAGAGNFLTGFMDFEQIFTLLAASGFTILAFLLFSPSTFENRKLSSFGKSPLGNWLFLGICMGLIFMTFRFQRSLPFDQKFYSDISKYLEAQSGPRFSAYLSSKSFYPFPTHIQAGFPLLFTYSDAISTPISMLEDLNWVGTEREGQIRKFPMMLFSQNDSAFKRTGNSTDLALRFLKKYAIRYVWIDQNKVSPIRNALLSARITLFESKTENLEFWVIDPNLL